jgi:hypothetical protein
LRLRLRLLQPLFWAPLCPHLLLPLLHREERQEQQGLLVAALQQLQLHLQH